MNIVVVGQYMHIFINGRLDSVLSPNTASATNLTENSASGEIGGASPSNDQNSAPKGSNGAATKDKFGKGKGASQKGKSSNTDNFSNINEVTKIKDEDHSGASQSPDVVQVEDIANHCNSVPTSRKDNDHKKSNNYRMNKYSNASIDSTATDSSIVSTSELHMTVLSKHDENLSPVAEV